MFKRLSPPVLLLLPAFIILAAVVLFPLALSLYSSFTPFRLTRPESLFNFIGFRNYQRILTDWVFWAAFIRTVVFLTIALNLECCSASALPCSSTRRRAASACCAR